MIGFSEAALNRLVDQTQLEASLDCLRSHPSPGCERLKVAVSAGRRGMQVALARTRSLAIRGARAPRAFCSRFKSYFAATD